MHSNEDKTICEKSVHLLGICLILGAASHASADLVGHWAFDEGQGTIAYDSSGNGHHGTLHGDPQWGVGKINGALELDGDGDYVEVPDHESSRLWERFTLAAWIYQRESRSSRIIDKIGAGTSNRPHLDTHPGTTSRSCSGNCISSSTDYTAAQAGLDPYSSSFSRHDFTQQQLFAVLALRQFFKNYAPSVTPYRSAALRLRRSIIDMLSLPPDFRPGFGHELFEMDRPGPG